MPITTPLYRWLVILSNKYFKAEQIRGIEVSKLWQMDCQNHKQDSRLRSRSRRQANNTSSHNRMIACWHRMWKGKRWKKRIWSFNKRSIYRDFRRTSYSINKNKRGKPKSWMKLVWLGEILQPIRTNPVAQTPQLSLEKQRKVLIVPKLLSKEVPWV